MRLHDYVPTLAIRPCEMNGLEFLPGKSKDRMSPCILLNPWLTAKTLEKAINRVERAFSNRHYYLDLNRDYSCTDPKNNSAQQKFLNLFESANWIDFIKEHQWVWPCIQYKKNQGKAEIKRQIKAVQALERQYCLRIEYGREPPNLNEIVSAFAESGTADFVIILEGGWTQDALSLSAWYERILSGELKKIDADVPVVLSCTSIPREFSNFKGICRKPFSNRQLLETIGPKSNRTAIIYGDWGSTRPQDPNRGGRQPLARIDYPTKDAWYIVRDRENGWDFEMAAENLIKKSGVWDGKLGIWGEQKILNTITVNVEAGINNYLKNIAARVNIHLHRQAFYGQEDKLPTLDFDDDWED